MEIDDVVEALNRKWSRFQILTFSLLCLPYISHATFYMSYVFTAVKSEHIRCYIPECEGEGSASDWLHFAVPFKNGEPEPCLRYRHRSEELGLADCVPTTFSNETQLCEHRFYPNPQLSILTEWDIACGHDSEWLESAVGLSNNLGRIVGQTLSGFLSDHFGRKLVMRLGLAGSSVISLIRSFSPNYDTFVALEFIDPIFHDGLTATAFLLGVELMPVSMRGPWSAISHIAFPVGAVYLGCIAWLLPFWRVLLRVICGTALFTLAAVWMVPESIRWLWSSGRTTQAVDVIKHAARMSNIPIEELKLDSIKLSNFDTTNAGRPESKNNGELTFFKEFLCFVKSRVLLFRLVCCCLCWVVNMLVYDGLSVNSVSMAGNGYLNFILVSLVEIPGGAASWLGMRLAGRRTILSASLFLTSASCLAYHFLSNEWRVLVVLLAKLGITVSFAVMYVVSAEVFPTRLRHTLCALCSTSGRLGSLLAPQTRLLIAYLDSLPFIVFGGAALFTGTLSLALPETSACKLPDTVLEAEQLRSGSGSPVPPSHGHEKSTSS